MMNSDGGMPHQLTNRCNTDHRDRASDGTNVIESHACPPVQCDPNDWSPDGRTLILTVRTPNGVRRVDDAGGPERAGRRFFPSGRIRHVRDPFTVGRQPRVPVIEPTGKEWTRHRVCDFADTAAEPVFEVSLV